MDNVPKGTVDPYLAFPLSPLQRTLKMRVQAGAQERQDRIIQAALTKTDLLAMDDGGDGDGKVSPYEFLCSTLVALVSNAVW